MKKSPPYIPPPGPHFREDPTSKHAKGRTKIKYRGRYEGGGNGNTPGAFGTKPSTRVKKTLQAKLLATSNRIHGERSVKEMYAEWRRGMSPEELALARKLKVHQPADANGEFGKPKKDQVDVEFHDPADLPEASLTDHPIDRMEPQSAFSVAIAALNNAEITAAADCFGDALTWALDVPDIGALVMLGNRALAMIYKLRPDLVTGDEAARARHFLHWEITLPTLALNSDFASTGEIFGRVLEWIRRGTSISAIGERLCLVAYVVRPQMIDSPTLASLGETMNKTRQAKDKLVQCLRDTFAGLKAVAMRGEDTRTRCQLAHS